MLVIGIEDRPISGGFVVSPAIGQTAPRRTDADDDVVVLIHLHRPFV
jgi:hypothetical protein